jgi:hypothetical protein
MDVYLRAASQISRLAVGDRNASVTSVTYKIGGTVSQTRHVDGTPVGTRGGTAVTHVFPADNDYVIKARSFSRPRSESGCTEQRPHEYAAAAPGCACANASVGRC